jgi:hypothetical protein
MNSRILSIVLIVLIMASLLFPTITAVTDESGVHYVDDTDDLQTIITNAGPGDTICLAPGEYEYDPLYVDKPLTIVGSGIGETIILGRIILEEQKYHSKMMDEMPLASYEISNLTITNEGSCPTVFAERLPPSSSFYIHDCSIEGGGISLGNFYEYEDSQTRGRELSHQYVRICNNNLKLQYPRKEINNMGEPAAAFGIFVFLEQGSVDIRANDISSYEVGIFAYAMGPLDVTIVNNLIHECYMGLYAAPPDAFSSEMNDGVADETIFIANNTIHTFVGLNYVESETAVVSNNIFAWESMIVGSKVGVSAIFTIIAEEDLWFDNNDMFCYSNVDTIQAKGPVKPYEFPIPYDYIELLSKNMNVTGNIFQDPEFIRKPELIITALGSSDSGYDFHLASTSPCIDAGTTVNVEDDIEGTTRPQGPAYDIGAYEQGENDFTPGTIKPLVTTSMNQALNTWNDVLSQLPDTPSEEQQALVGEIQSLIERAGSLGNPVAANGALQKAITLMGNL